MRHHIVAVKIRMPEDVSVEEAGSLVFDALRVNGYEVVVESGNRTLSNFGEALDRYRRQDVP